MKRVGEESAEKEEPAKGTEQERPKRLTENLEHHGKEVKDSVSRRKCLTDLNAAEN